MEITSTIVLTDKQSSALSKRVDSGSTVEALAASIVVEQAQRWVNDDYSTLSALLVSQLKDQPQAVLDAIIGQIVSIAPIIVDEPTIVDVVGPEPVVVENAEPI